MLASSTPTRFLLPWAKNAAGAYIRTVPVTSQIGIQDGAASYNDGFVPDNFTALAAGGVPPFGQDMNGVLNETTTWDQWYQAGGPIPYDATFATAIGGYPKGATLPSASVIGKQWASLVDNNLTNPDDPLTSANWAELGIPTGTPVPFLTPTLPFGFLPMNGLTIGSPSSNATLRATFDVGFLYGFNWLNFSNSQCPILTSAGAPTTRGANAVADYLANKQLTMPNAKGLGMIGADTMGGAASTFLAGAPVTIGSTTLCGSILGETLHALIAGELAAHAHASTLTDPGHPHNIINNTSNSLQGIAFAVSGAFGTSPGGAQYRLIDTVNGGITAASNVTGITINNASAGSGAAHNTVHRSMVCYWGQKL